MKIVSHTSQLIGMVTALMFITSAEAGSEIEDIIKKSFRVGVGGRLTLDTDRGSIEVHGVDSDTLEVEIIRKVYARDRDEADEILKDLEIGYTQRGNDVHISADFKKDWPAFGGCWGLRRPRLRLHYLVSVPTKYNVDLRTAGGSISVDDLEGEVHSKTSGGSLHFGLIQGPVRGRTSGGSIALDECVGKADVHTSGGSISIGEVDGDVSAHTSGGSIRIARAEGSVVAKTSGGSITVEEITGYIEAITSGGSVAAHIAAQPQKDCRLQTSGGSVVVYLAPDIAVDVDAKTIGGRIDTEFPITVKGQLGRTSLQGKINGGGPELFLHTTGGNIHLRKK